MALRLISKGIYNRGSFVGVTLSDGLFLGNITKSSSDGYLYVKLTDGRSIKIESKRVSLIKGFSLSQLTGKAALKRCPFCNHKPTRTRIRDGGLTFRCSNSKCIIYDDHQGFDNMEKAIEPWNRRPSTTTPTSSVACI